MESRWIRSGALGVACLVALVCGSARVTLAEEHGSPEGGVVSSGDEGAVASEGSEKQDDGQEEKSDAERISELEKAVDVLASELSKALADEAVPEERLESVWGLGPAASKVYRKDQGLSIGGYGEYRVTDYVGGGSDGLDTVADALRAVLYVGYKFSDKWVVNSEIEFEHGSTEDDGAVSVEFLTLDWQFSENHGLRSGLLLAPMGFINEIHEPTFFYGVDRPEVERRIIPTTWREVGGGFFGQFAGGRISYRAYGINGFDAQGFSVSGLRGGRQNGSEAVANQWAFVARTDVQIVDGLETGGSFYVGPSGQKQTDPDTTLPIPNTLTTLYELHVEYKAYGLSLRGLFTQAFLHDTGELNVALGNSNAALDNVASRMLGAYGEVAYDVLPLLWKSTRASVEPYFRYERVDTQNRMSPTDVANLNYVRDIYQVGLQIKPIPNVVFKIDYRNFKPKAGEIANQVQFGAGYVF